MYFICLFFDALREIRFWEGKYDEISQNAALVCRSSSQGTSRRRDAPRANVYKKIRDLVAIPYRIPNATVEVKARREFVVSNRYPAITGRYAIRKYAPSKSVSIPPPPLPRDRPRRVAGGGGDRAPLIAILSSFSFSLDRGRAIPFASRSQCSARIYYLTGIIDGLWIRVPGVRIPRDSRHFRDGDAPRGRKSRSSSLSAAANRRRVKSRNLPGGK